MSKQDPKKSAQSEVPIEILREIADVMGVSIPQLDTRECQMKLLAALVESFVTDNTYSRDHRLDLFRNFLTFCRFDAAYSLGESLMGMSKDPKVEVPNDEARKVLEAVGAQLCNSVASDCNTFWTRSINLLKVLFLKSPERLQ